MWLLDRMTPESAAYNIGMLLKAPGALDEKRVGQAFRELASRHDALRTRFVEREDGSPAVCLEEGAEVPLELVTLAPGEAPMALAERFTDRTFDLSEAPLCRAALIRGAEDGSDYLAVSIHHIVSDVWSLGILLSEFLALYEGRPAGAAPQLRYVDVAQKRERKTLAEAARIVRTVERLRGLEPAELPLDFARPETDDLKGRNLHRVLSAETVRGLWKIAGREKTSLFSVLTALWGEWLHAYTGRSDLVFGTIDAGRDDPETAPVIGFFAETVPVRLRVRDTLADSIREAAKALREARASAAPYDELVAARRADAMKSGSREVDGPLVRLMLVHDSRNDILPPMRRRGWDAFEVDTPTAQFDVALYFSEDGDKLHVKLAYAEPLFREETMAAWLDALMAAIEAAARGEPDPFGKGRNSRGGAGEKGASSAGTFAPTPHQERLWFVDRFEKGDLYAGAPVYYNMGEVRRINDDEAPVTPEALKAALRTLSDSRECLRLAVRPDASEHPEVVVLPALSHPEIPVLVVERTDDETLAQAIHRPFDLAEAPLARAILSTDGRTLGFAIHHIAADERTAARLLNELIELVRNPDCLPQEETAFSDWTKPLNRKDWLETEDARWWKQTLDGMGKLDLLGDYPRTPIQLYSGDRVSFRLPALSVATARGLFAAMLHRLSADADIVMGDVLDASGENVFGAAANLLPLRLRITCPDETLGDYLERVEAVRGEALRHGGMPFDRVVFAADPENDMSRTALFDVLFVGHETQSGFSGWGWGKYDLVLSYEPDGSASLIYNTLYFARASVERMAGRLVRWAEGLINGSEELLRRPVMSLPAELPADDPGVAERLAEIRDSVRNAPKTIHEAFNAAAGLHADRVAVVAAADQETGEPRRALTYRELNIDAEAIGRKLASLGARPDARVAVLTNRSAGTIAAFLGVVKSGAGYVPMDPAYPDERLQYILTNSEAAILLADKANFLRAQKLAGLLREAPALVLLEDAIAEGARASDEPPLPATAGAKSLAYIIYTSGSTGTPKGVMIENHSVTSLIFQKGLPFTPAADDIWSMCHSSAFDFSVWEMYGALLTGGTVVVVPRSRAADPSVLKEERVTRLSLTPTAFYALADEMLASETALPELKSVVFGGEALQPKRLAAWHKAWPAVRLINMYGITETTVHVTAVEIDDAVIEDGRSFVGDAIPAWGLALLDENLELVPFGTPGEICVYGEGVARGYAGLPEKTNERFVSAPALGGVRVYRSGDIGRFSESGLEYLGRMDDQVKIRGFRVELSEIDRALLSHPAVRDAVAMPVPAADAETPESVGDILVAFLVLEPGADLAHEALRRYLAEKIPEYMIPNVFYVSESVPRTGNGKTDRRELKRLMKTLPALPSEAAQASEETERAAAISASDGRFQEVLREITSLWREVLDLPEDREIGPEENFFRLGGHSLKANRVVVRLRRAFGIELSLKAFFTAPTPALLANLILERLGESCAASASTPEEKPLEAASQVRPVTAPVSGAQKRILLWQAKNPGSSAYNMTGGFRIEGRLDEEKLQEALNALVVRHEALRTHFEIVKGELVQVIEPPQPFPLEVEEAEREDRIEEAIREESNFEFDLSRAPLLRVRLIELPHGDALIFNMHHVLGDGWSSDLLLRELCALYNGEDPAKLPKAGTPREAAEEELSRTAALEAKLHADEKLLQKLVPLPEPLELPSDRPRPLENSGTKSGRFVSATLSREASLKLRSWALASNGSLFMSLATLLAVELYGITGAEDFVIGSPVAGRSTPEAERTIALFLNMIPLRLHVEREDTAAGLFARTQSEVLDAFELSEYPFDRLIEKLDRAGVRTAPGREPVYDVMMILQNNDPLELSLAGMKAKLIEDISAGAKLDLNFEFDDFEEIRLRLEYREDMFDRERAQGWADAFAAMAEKLAQSDPDELRVKDLCEVLEARPQDASAAGTPAAEALAKRLLAQSEQADDDEW